MGCEQSSDRKVTPEPARWSTRVLSQQIQTQMNGDKDNKMAEKVTVQPKMDETIPHEIRKLLLEYQGIEEEIDSIERGEPLTIFYIKKSNLESILKRISEQQDKISDLQNGEEGLKVSSVKQALAMLGDKELTKEDHKLLADLNNLEIALTELEIAHQEKALTENEVRNLHSILFNLQKLYRQQEADLQKLSMNDETPEETRLHKELADIESRRMKVSEIYQRWMEGRLKIYETCRQLSAALTKWRNFPSDSSHLIAEMGEDIRDDLINAVQNLANCKCCIRMELPYCTNMEQAILNQAVTYLFVDLRSQERRTHAELCYAAIHKRAVALFAWIDKTIELVIEPELSGLTRVINEKANRLKYIRKEEIRSKYPGIQIHDKNPNPATFQFSDFDVQSNFTTLDGETDKVYNELEFDQLAPLPSTDEISSSRNADDLTQTFKTELREELEMDERKSKDTSTNNADEIITHRSRRNTLSRKLL